MDRQRQSGLSVRGFCRREVVSEASFSAWRRERESLNVRRTDRESGVRPAASRSTVAQRAPTTVVTTAVFLPVLMESNSDHLVRVLEVTCPNGSRVRAWSGCAVELLQAALSVVTQTARVGRNGRGGSC